MKKLLVLLFIPIVCFGQEDIDYSSKKSIYNYIEANPSSDLLEGVWDNLDKRVGAVMIRKNSKKKYLVIACAGGLDEGWVVSSTENQYNMPGDTIAILEKSFGGEKLFVSLNTNEIVETPKNKRTVKGVRESIIDYTSLSQPIGIFRGGSTTTLDFVFSFPGPGGIIRKNLHFKRKYEEKNYLLDPSIEANYFFNNLDEDLYVIMDIGKGSPLIKIFPKPIFNKERKLKQTEIKTKIKTDKWAGNGSGIVISKSGHIVTNNHVIEDADNIEIEIISNGEIQKFNAEVVQKDLRNDLAILKIVDVDFNGFGAINYNFKSRSSDVGTKIYTFGYPKALSGMGKEIKVTEGIISSKSGIMGDITTYQITAPIQGGNSGGPLFDDKGNLVGINSSRFKSDETENVNYSIKSSYVLNLIDVLPKSIDLPSSTKLQSLPLTEQIKEISKYVVLVKVN